jgi:hypothetical protein
MQLLIQVTRINKKRPKWGIRITEISELPYTRWFLPQFTSWSHASLIAESLANVYRMTGYEVALDTKTCRQKHLRYAAAYIYP